MLITILKRQKIGFSDLPRSDINVITKLIKDVKFFKERNLSNNDLVQVSQSLQYEFVPKGEIVFEHGK